MARVIVYALVAVLPLIFGAAIGAKLNVKERIIGIISAFGAGAMLAALTFGLMEESFKLGGFDSTILGFIIGGALFVLGDYIIINIGGRGHKRVYKSDTSTGWGIVLGAILDGIPESIALGISLLLNVKLGILVLIAIIFNNLPEAVSSGYDLKKIHKPFREIITTWIIVALIGFIFVFVGYSLLSGLSLGTISTLEAIAAGAILAMLSVTMMPEAYRESGFLASIATISGFMVIFILSKLGA